MWARMWLAAALTAVGAAAALADSAPSRAEQLVARLGSGAYRDREAASRELDALGADALDALRKAVASADPETRRRATELVERITERLVAVRMLTPSTIEFKYENKLLTEAVADFNRRTGAAIILADPTKYHGRTITVATPGPIPFWDAVELLCRKADLNEWDGFARIAGLGVHQQASTQIINQGVIGGQVVVRSGRYRQVGPPPNSVVLIDGPGAALPTWRAGAVQIRVPPPGSHIDGMNPVGSSEFVVPLQVLAEPKLHWQGVVDVRIDRVLDDVGQNLTASPAARNAGNDEEGLLILNGVLVQGHAIRSAPVGILVKRGSKPSTRLAEMAGAVVAQVRIVEPLVKMDEPLKMAGQSVRGHSGVDLKVTSAAQADNGEVTISAEVHMPSDVQIVPQAAAAQMMFQFAQGRAAVVKTDGLLPELQSGTTDFLGLALEDGKGQKFAAVRGMVMPAQFLADGLGFKSITVYKPAEAGHDAGRLVFTASRPATIDIPFTIKDIPLP